MHITVRQLQVFEAVARRLSYTRAAEELHLTQPAVSMQIKQLEGSVGMPLFEQMGKRFISHRPERLCSPIPEILCKISPPLRKR